MLLEGSGSKEIMKGPALEFAAKALAEDRAGLTSANLIGRSVSHYCIKEKIGAGGMGEVYKAEDVRLGRVVAIKVLAEGVLHDDEARHRFQREARALAQLSHPHILSVFKHLLAP